MPRGQKRTEIEIIQAQIDEAQKRRKKSIEAANAEKLRITALEKQVEKTIADNIAKACRAKGIGLEMVLNWVLAQPSNEPAPDVPAVPSAKPGRRKVSAAKTTAKSSKPRKKALGKRSSVKATQSEDVLPESSEVPSSDSAE